MSRLGPASSPGCSTSDLSVITPTFRRDASLFHELHQSVLEYTPPDTVHYAIVPPADRSLFARYEGSRCRIVTYEDIIPRRYIAVPGKQLWINARRPWPPVRGWIMQQLVKIAMAGRVDSRAVLMADSDVALVRPVSAAAVLADGSVRTFRDPRGVRDEMERHVLWHRVACTLLKLPAPPRPPLPDYISPLNIWEPDVVRSMQEHISRSNGKGWMDLISSQLHFSEFILYGVFVDEIAKAHRPPPTYADICHNSWERVPLDTGSVPEFVEGMSPEALGVMISAHSHTAIDVRRSAIDACSRRLEVVRRASA